MRTIQLTNQTRPLPRPLHARYCGGFFCRLRGLMFAASLAPDQSLLMAHPTQDRANAAIHMFFMRFDLAVIWLDAQRRVVDVQPARRWQPMLAPARPARYVLEAHPSRLSDFQVGDQLDWSDLP